MIELYHGTSEVIAKAILEEGFKTGLKGKWDAEGAASAADSQKGFVYLTNTWGPFYSYSRNKTPTAALIKVRVDENNLFPDEDFLVDIQTCKRETEGEVVSRAERLAIARTIDISQYQEHGVMSLERLGNVAARPSSIEILDYQTMPLTDAKQLIDCKAPGIFEFMLYGERGKIATRMFYEGSNVSEILTALPDV